MNLDDAVIVAMAAYTENEWRTSESAMRAALTAAAPLIAQECATIAQEIADERMKEWHDGGKYNSRIVGMSGGAEKVADATRQRFKTNG